MPSLASWGPGLLLGVLLGACCAFVYLQRRHRRLTAALDDERRRLHIVAEAAPIVIVSFRLAPDGTWSFPFSTSRIRDIYGMSLEAFARHGIGRVIAADDVARLAQSVRDSASSLSPWHQTYRVDHPERGQIWVEGRAMPVRDADGGTTWHGTLSDVTERKRIEQELEAREQLLLQMGEVAAVGGWEFDLVAGTGRWTPQVATLHGLPPETAPSKAVLDLYVPEARARIEAALAGATQGQSCQLDVELVAPDGTHRWVRILGHPIVEQGAVTRVRGALWDISAAKAAEAVVDERLALQSQLSQLAVASPGVIYAFLHAADGRISFPYASPQLDDLFGVDPQAVVDDAGPVLERIHPEDLAQIRGSLDRSAQTMLPWQAQFRVLHPTRGTIWIEGRSEPSAQPDGGILCHGFFIDVTSRRLLEEQYRQSQKMEAIGQLAGGVAHDFNNLLTVILGNATLLAEQSDDEPAEHAREIARAAERAAALTRQLLLFSRRQVMHPVNLDLNEVLENMTRLLQRILGEDVALHESFAPRLPAAWADPGMLEQVLLNLAVNSRDAMPDGGDLFVTTSLMATDDVDAVDVASDVPAWLCLTVHDTGIGMPPEVQAHIFEPFYTTKAPGKGTGLGLATVYGIVQQHGGSVRVSSSPGAGTTFRILLPASPGSVERREPPPPRVSAPSVTATVLVVEDEPAVRLLTAAVLEGAGYEVLTAATGRTALEAWRGHRQSIAVVVTDIVMPEGMTGIELSRLLHADDPGLPVIFVSGYQAATTATKVVLQEGVNFLQKPFQLDALTKIVRLAIEGRRGQARSNLP